MPLHIIKLCVGADSIEDLQQWIDETQAERRRLGRPAEQVHTTRMAPRRRDEVLDGGSLYWVIRGVLQVRQPIRDLRPVKGDDGIERCEIVLEPVLFGLALTVKNFEDSGALWLRTAISVEVAGDSFDVFVAQQPMIRIPLDYQGQLEPVFEAIYREFLNTFQLEVLEFNDKRFETRIGFVPEK